MINFIKKLFKSKEDRINFNGFVFLRVQIHWKNLHDIMGNNSAKWQNYCRLFSVDDPFYEYIFVIPEDDALMMSLKYNCRIMKESEIKRIGRRNYTLSEMYRKYQ